VLGLARKGDRAHQPGCQELAFSAHLTHWIMAEGAPVRQVSCSVVRRVGRPCLHNWSGKLGFPAWGNAAGI
jgi:hypothetical protein